MTGEVTAVVAFLGVRACRGQRLCVRDETALYGTARALGDRADCEVGNVVWNKYGMDLRPTELTPMVVSVSSVVVTSTCRAQRMRVRDETV